MKYKNLQVEKTQKIAILQAYVLHKSYCKINVMRMFLKDTSNQRASYTKSLYWRQMQAL